MYRIIFMLFTILFLLTGCMESKVNTNNEAPKEGITEFSYLNNLSEDEISSYNLFKKDKDINHLRSFSSENIVLVYLHSVAENDLEGIYSLTYHGEITHDFFEFEKQYSKKRQLKDENFALTFRNYDSISSKESKVNLKVSFGSISYSLFIAVKKEHDVWKVDMS
ncbi:hypothetical protein [Paraliobacillus salinarum]|uniref:hypothetical protein n=1 Tax=Paraliobacillus salinarum TaxID=1158996 RepID=UPI0015F3B18E|nr:hypothetical protein [Paraliobacillus salinarum]